MSHMRRRQFITLLGGAAVAWPLAARAQQPGKLPTIGFLGATSPTIWSAFVGAFVQRLRELGWIDGHNIAIEYRWGEGRDDLYAAFAAEFVQRRVDVIVTAGTTATMSVKKRRRQSQSFLLRLVTRSKPGWSPAWRARAAMSLVYRTWRPILVASDLSCCVRSCLLSIEWLSLAMSIALSSGWKWSGSRRRPPSSALMQSGSKLGRWRISSQASKRSKALPMRCMFAAIPSSPSSGFASTRWRSAPDCQPCMRFEHVRAGGLMSYGPNFPDLFRRSGDYVDKNSSRLEARRHPRRAAGQVRSGVQQRDREGARLNHPQIVFGARHRNDRMIFQLQFKGATPWHSLAVNSCTGPPPRLGCRPCRGWPIRGWSARYLPPSGPLLAVALATAAIDTPSPRLCPQAHADCVDSRRGRQADLFLVGSLRS